MPSGGAQFRLFLLQGLDAARAVGLIALGIGMLVVFGVGVAKISIATWHLAESLRGTGTHTSMSSVTDFLKGLEYFFLAPLGLLAFRSLGAFVVVQLSTPDQGVPTPLERAAESRLHSLKIWIAGLIAALIATDLVSRVLATPGIRFADLDGELAALIVILLYVWVVSRHTPSHSG